MFDTQEMRTPALPSETLPAVPLPPVNAGQPVHLLDRLTALFKHRRIAGTAFLLVVTVMMLQSYSTIPRYHALARIEVQNPRSVQMSTSGAQDQYFEDSDIFYATQLQILGSRDLARRVAERLELEKHPDFNGATPRPRDPVSLIRQARASASGWVRGLIARPSPAADPVAAAATPEDSGPSRGLVSAFLSGLHTTQQKLTSVFDIRYEHTNPAFAAAAANAVAEEYIAQNVAVRLSDTEKRLAFVTEELNKAQERLRAANESMTRYREDNNALELKPGQNIIETGLNDAAAEHARARGRLSQMEILWNHVRDVDPTTDSADSHPSIGTSSGVVTARAQLAQLEQRRNELTARGLGPNLPEMKALANDLQIKKDLLVAERRKVIEQARNEYEQARAEERSFASAVSVAKSNSMALSKKGGEYQILSDRASTEQTLFQNLLEEKNKLEVIFSSRANNARLIDRAEPIRTPISPNSTRDLLTAILAGLTLAFGLAFGIEYLDDTVKTPEDVTKRLKLPLLGLVPAVKGDHVPLLTETVPHDFGEAFRSLRTSLVFTSGGESTRVIAVTSSQPLEGKTTTAANVAFALALGGSRVLLIDADMRRPGLHKTIGLQNDLGLSHLLTGQARVRDAVQRSVEPNLFVITAGRTPPNPSELLASARMTQLLQSLTQGPFDWVIVDTPPILAVTDAVIVAQKVSGVMFVIGSEMTRRVHAERALETLQSAKIRSVGVVLNRVDFDRNKYYYSRYYGYQYKSYYGQNPVT
jgi:capsular exopolysaccharide synthesis family protein